MAVPTGCIKKKVRRGRVRLVSDCWAWSAYRAPVLARPERRGREQEQEHESAGSAQAFRQAAQCLSPVTSLLGDSAGNCASRVTEEGLDAIRKRWRSNWITETKRRSPRAAVSRTESALRLLPARQTHDVQSNDLRTNDLQTN